MFFLAPTNKILFHTAFRVILHVFWLSAGFFSRNLTFSKLEMCQCDIDMGPDKDRLCT